MFKLAVLAVPLLPMTMAAESNGGLDVGATLVAYGVAAPFAALCLVQLQRLQRKLDERDAQIERLNQAALDRERDVSMRVAPFLHDAAQLYQRGNEQLAKGLQSQTPPAPASPAELAELTSDLHELVQRLRGEERP